MIKHAFAYGTAVAAALLLGSLLGSALAGCYDTTAKTPTCSANSHQDGCLEPIHDSAKVDGGR